MRVRRQQVRVDAVGNFVTANPSNRLHAQRVRRRTGRHAHDVCVVGQIADHLTTQRGQAGAICIAWRGVELHDPKSSLVGCAQQCRGLRLASERVKRCVTKLDQGRLIGTTRCGLREAGDGEKARKERRRRWIAQHEVVEGRSNGARPEPTSVASNHETSPTRAIAPRALHSATGDRNGALAWHHAHQLPAAARGRGAGWPPDPTRSYGRRPSLGRSSA